MKLGNGHGSALQHNPEPQRAVAAPQEKGRLLPFGRKPGMKFQELISVVGDQSFVVRDAV